MIYKIHTLGGYFHEYQKSLTNNEAFWEQQAESFFLAKALGKSCRLEF